MIAGEGAAEGLGFLGQLHGSCLESQEVCHPERSEGPYHNQPVSFKRVVAGIRFFAALRMTNAQKIDFLNIFMAINLGEAYKWVSFH